MAQGVEFTEKERDNIIQSIRPHLELGFSRNKACALVGLPPQTLSNWVKEDESLGMLLTSWENMTSAIAMANIQMAIRKEAESPDDVRKENSWKWAQTKEETMKPKQDVTTNDKDLPSPIIHVPVNNSHSEDNSDAEESAGSGRGN